LRRSVLWLTDNVLCRWPDVLAMYFVCFLWVRFSAPVDGFAYTTIFRSSFVADLFAFVHCADRMLSGWPDELAFILVSRFSVEFADRVDGGESMKKCNSLLRRVPS